MNSNSTNWPQGPLTTCLTCRGTMHVSDDGYWVDPCPDCHPLDGPCGQTCPVPFDARAAAAAAGDGAAREWLETLDVARERRADFERWERELARPDAG